MTTPKLMGANKPRPNHRGRSGHWLYSSATFAISFELADGNGASDHLVVTSTVASAHASDVEEMFLSTVSPIGIVALYTFLNFGNECK
jgi:hypothetical protein